MTDFDAGTGRRPQHDERPRGDAPVRRAPAPRYDGYDGYDAPTGALPAQRPAARQYAGLLVGDTGPLPHISAPLPDMPWATRRGDETSRGHETSRGYDGEYSTGAQARHRGGFEEPRDGSGQPAPLPPRPSGPWSRLRGGSDAPDGRHGTHRSPAADGGSRHADGHPVDDQVTEGFAFDDRHLDDPGWEDRTGGLEVIGAHVDDGRRSRRLRRRGRSADPRTDEHDLRRAAEHRDMDRDFDRDGEHLGDHPGDEADLHEELVADPLGDEDIPLKPYDPRRSRRRRRRRRAAGLIAVVVLAAVVLGIVFGGSKLLGVINPSARDYTGAGYGSVDIRVHDGDTLSDIARTLVDAQVLAGTGHFVKAAESNPAATGIAPGVYGMRLHMSGKAALDRLLDPSSRLLTRVTVPEGLTVVTTLKRLADETHVPLADLQAAAKNPAAIGLPAYANGSLEGFLFPATYDFEPHTTAVQMLTAMVTRAVQALDKLNIPADQRLAVLTKASIVQAEAGSVADMGKIATVIDNRLAAKMPLQLDTTVNYATGKTSVTTTDADRANPSPYNTYLHPGLPPGPISNPGEEALKAVLSPTPGPWLFFVVVNPDTGETRFAVTPQEHQANVALFQQWLRAHPNG